MKIAELIGETTEYDKKQMLEGKKLILLNVYSGDETPYYYVDGGEKTAFLRVGNESVPADRAKLKELVLKGSSSSYDSLKSKYKFSNMAFTKLKSAYKQRTGDDFEESDYDMFFLVLKNLNYESELIKEYDSITESAQKERNNYPETAIKTTKKSTKKTIDVIIEIIKKNPDISVKEIAEIVGLTVDGVQYHIRNLKSHDVIERVGPDKGGYWKIKNDD